MLKIVVFLLSMTGEPITYYQTEPMYPDVDACMADVMEDAENGTYDEMIEEQDGAVAVNAACTSAGFDPDVIMEPFVKAKSI